MVAPNRQILEWSIDLASSKPIALPHHYRPDRVKRFRTAISKLEAMPQSSWPERDKAKRRKRDKDFEKRVDELIKSRDQTAAKLDIEGSLIAPRAALESIAADESQAPALLLEWQLECLGMKD
jgi:ribonuclease D